jgi:hypothetical protein
MKTNALIRTTRLICLQISHDQLVIKPPANSFIETSHMFHTRPDLRTINETSAYYINRSLLAFYCFSPDATFVGNFRKQQWTLQVVWKHVQIWKKSRKHENFRFSFSLRSLWPDSMWVAVERKGWGKAEKIYRVEQDEQRNWELESSKWLIKIRWRFEKGFFYGILRLK